jgi:cell division protein ZipA
VQDWPVTATSQVLNMENIRLILLLIGAVIVLGIYVFSRMQGQWRWPRISLPKLSWHRKPRKSRLQRGNLAELDDIDTDVEFDAGFDADIDSIGAPITGDPLDPGYAPAPGTTVIRPRVKRGQEDRAPLQESKAPVSDMIFTLFVMAPSGVPFRGPMLLDALEAAHLEYGDMQIFHRNEVVDGSKRHQFSAANIKEPGIFDLAAMENFATEGVVLFLQVVPGMDAVRAFDAMVDSAMIMADELGATVCDATRSVLTKQTISHMREEVIGCQLQQRVIKTAS